MRAAPGAHLLAGMTSPEVREHVARGRSAVVVPFGAVEQHGPHLALDADAALGDRLGLLLAQRLDALCAPTVRLGCSRHHLAFAGTLSLRPGTLVQVATDVLDSVAATGFGRVVLLPTHGGNEEPLVHAAVRWRSGTVVVAVPRLSVAVEAVRADAAARGHPLGDAGGHAGELETSLLLALAPDLVDVDRLEPGYTGEWDDAAVRTFFDDGVQALSGNGVLGDPRTASAEAGRAYVAAFLDAVERQVLEAWRAGRPDRPPGG